MLHLEHCICLLGTNFQRRDNASTNHEYVYILWQNTFFKIIGCDTFRVLRYIHPEVRQFCLNDNLFIIYTHKVHHKLKRCSKSKGKQYDKLANKPCLHNINYEFKTTVWHVHHKLENTSFQTRYVLFMRFSNVLCNLKTWWPRTWWNAL